MIDRTKAPVPSENISFEIPKINYLTSPKGYEIFYISKEKLPIVSFNIILFSGSKFDPENKKGLALLTSFMIDEGAGKYDAFQLSNEFEKLGTIFSITVNHDTFSFSILSLKENFERSLELLSIILNEPRFDEKDFQREKKKLINKIKQMKDEPSYIASTAFDRQIFQECYYSYPSIGYENTVNNITLDDVKEFYNKYIKNSKKKFIAAGCLMQKEISDLIDKYFTTKEIIVPELELKLPEKASTKYFIVHKENSAQGEIRIGKLDGLRKSPDYFANKLMNSILGGEFFSRINLNLREKKGFTYGAHSSFNYYQKAGYFEIGTAVNIENVGESISEILYELNNIKQNITQEEINLAKSFLIKHFPSNFESYSQLSQSIALLVIHNLPLNYYNEYINNIQLVTENEILNAAKRNIHTDELTILVVGDKNKILPQLKILTNELIELDIYGNIVEKLNL